ncbi:hypothetical protein LJY25_08795 [Hymenobacter sp. BT175]|uniref:hypothetical protein n=1 Tax=Hymenobacter translucens TaxID=2886507 RepID=UPI001D0E6757|nr:hypothetical protein [Hymenobacter translucens]MCC2546538.1 hypothetical protein [Hymenobacter translucens]
MQKDILILSACCLTALFSFTTTSRHPRLYEAGAALETVSPADSLVCARATPKPVLRKKVFPKSGFRLLPDKQTALEKVTLANGDQLMLRHWGCEYYALTFRFETARFTEPTSQRAAWHHHAVGLMRSVLPGVDAPLDLEKGVKYLNARLVRRAKTRYRNQELREEITFDEGEIRSFVTVDKIEKLPGGKSAVELTFASGPL